MLIKQANSLSAPLHANVHALSIQKLHFNFKMLIRSSYKVEEFEHNPNCCEVSMRKKLLQQIHCVNGNGIPCKVILGQGGQLPD